MRMVFVNKEEGWLYDVKGKVKEFADAYKGVRYFKRNKLEDKGFRMTVEGVQK